jgi:putative nucleotidyltransferase with HDIG domain
VENPSTEGRVEEWGRSDWVSFYQLLMPPQIAANDPTVVAAKTMRRAMRTSTVGVSGPEGITRLREVQAGFKKIATPLVLYVVGVGGLAVAVLAAAATSDSGDFEPVLVLVLGLLAFAAERASVSLSSHTQITAAALPTLFAAVAVGPTAAMAIAAIGLLADFRRPFARWLIWTASRATAGGLASMTYFAFGPSGDLGMKVAAITVATVVGFSVDAGLNAATLAVRRKDRIGAYLRMLRPVLLSSLPFYSGAITVLFVAYQEIGMWSVPLFSLPAFWAHRFYHLYRREQVSALRFHEANECLSRATVSFAAALVTALDARDHYTAGHSNAVAIYTASIARDLGLPADQQEIARLCGLLHDIGKVGLPAGLLEKEGPLTSQEKRLMQTHAVIGERILEKAEGYGEVARVVRHHHERIDGAGYPDSLRGAEIPLLSRIVCVADAFSAMTSDRPYRGPLPVRVARERLREEAGKQFDSDVVSALERVLDAEFGFESFEALPKPRPAIAPSAATAAA